MRSVVDGAPFRGGGDTLSDLRAVERPARPVGLDDDERHLVDPLERGEPVTARQALAPTPHGRALLGDAGVDDLGLVSLAGRAVHARQRTHA